jgi:hypothetical protein
VIFTVPDATPVRTPVLALIVANEVLTLVQAPPVELQESVVEAASHTLPVPVIDNARF